MERERQHNESSGTNCTLSAQHEQKDKKLIFMFIYLFEVEIGLQIAGKVDTAATVSH